MDEIEFRKRIYANPLEPGQEALDAARDNPAFQKILDETLELNSAVVSVSNSVAVPEGLRDRLLNLPAGAKESNVVAIGASGGGSNLFQFYAMAASLVLTLGVAFTMFNNPGPSAAELAISDEILNHLYSEIPELELIGNGRDRTAVSLPAINQILSAPGTRLVSNSFMNDMPVRSAKPCIILPTSESAHLILQGVQGSLSVIVINNSPVSTEYRFRDNRFNGVVVPTTEGNMILIGENNEDLDQYRDLFEENMDWVI